MTKRKEVCVFEDELLISSLRAQANRLIDVLAQMEADGCRSGHSAYYSAEVRSVERNLKKIRKSFFERIEMCVYN